MGLIGFFNAAATHPIANPVALGLQLLVFLFRNAAGVAEYVGSQRAMGIAAHHVHIHLGAPQLAGLLAKAQHLFWAQGVGQLNAKAIAVVALLVSLFQLGCRQADHLRQAIPQGRPLVFAQFLGL